MTESNKRIYFEVLMQSISSIMIIVVGLNHPKMLPKYILMLGDVGVFTVITEIIFHILCSFALIVLGAYGFLDAYKCLRDLEKKNGNNK